MDTQKQSVVERLTKANNVLVTVTSNPSVDQLAAAIGLSLVLNKLDKHATAVFSGAVPSTLEFLKPEETLEKNTDSLRDFIISLDKSKADKLRYKLEDEVVRIFITPYQTSISEADLIFSQGDINVDVVVALGVHEQQDIDQAVTAHGRILHDAAVITITNDKLSELGAINLFDEAASSLSELVSDIALLLGNDLLDQQIATALLTGIVAETGRFGNERTTAQTMRLSSALLAAGADQQLVATELEPEPEPVPEPVVVQPPEPVLPPVSNSAAPGSIEMPISPLSSQQAAQTEAPKEPLPPGIPLPAPEPEPVDEPDSAEIHIDANGTLQITHEPRHSATPPPAAPLPTVQPAQTPTESPSLIHKEEARTFLGNPEPEASETETVPDEDSPSLPSVEPAGGIPMLSHTPSAAAPPVSPPAMTEKANIDAARDAVLGAMGSSEQPLPPITALNAQPLGEPLHEAPAQTMTLPVPGGSVAPSDDQTQPPAGSAPPVPPPVMPFGPPPAQ